MLITAMVSIVVFLWWKVFGRWLKCVTCLQNNGFCYLYIAPSAIRALNPLLIELKKLFLLSRGLPLPSIVLHRASAATFADQCSTDLSAIATY